MMLAASPQLRNMRPSAATCATDALSPTIATPSWQACNKRKPGSGCGAIKGFNRQNASAGRGTSNASLNTQAISVVVLAAFGAEVELGRTRRPEAHSFPIPTPFRGPTAP